MDTTEANNLIAQILSTPSERSIVFEGLPVKAPYKLTVLLCSLTLKLLKHCRQKGLDDPATIERCRQIYLKYKETRGEGDEMAVLEDTDVLFQRLQEILVKGITESFDDKGDDSEALIADLDVDLSVDEKACVLL